MRRFSDATEWDRAVVRRQIGREPRGMVGVSRRCSRGCPQIVVTTPVLPLDDRSVPELFPTVYWLSCPHLCKAVAALESEQLIERFRARLQEDPELASRLDLRHRDYALERASLIDPDALESLKRSHPRLYKRVVEPGIGGIDIGGGVKCLHLHLADYLSRGANPIGEEVYLLLKHRGVSTDCDEGRCPGCADAVGVLNVGSNSVKLLVARAGEDDSGGCRLVTLTKQVRVTRLADGLIDRSKGAGPRGLILTEEAIRQTAEAVADLAAAARSCGVSAIRVYGTAAVRNASNSRDLAAHIRNRTGLELSILSSKLEAELSFEAACDALPSASLESAYGGVAVIDIGGASTEVAVGRRRETPRSISVEIGSLTSLARLSRGFDDDGRLPVDHLSDLLSHCRQAFPPDITCLVAQARAFVAVGGSVTASAALLLRLESYDPQAIHGLELDRSSGFEMLERMCQLTRHERERMQGMISKERADSIIGGMAILISLLDAARADRVYVSEHGLVEGLAARLLSGGIS